MPKSSSCRNGRQATIRLRAIEERRTATLFRSLLRQDRKTLAELSQSQKLLHRKEPRQRERRAQKNLNPFTWMKCWWKLAGQTPFLSLQSTSAVPRQGKNGSLTLFTLMIFTINGWPARPLATT